METIITITTHAIMLLAGLVWGFGLHAMLAANNRRKRIFPRPGCHSGDIRDQVISPVGVVTAADRYYIPSPLMGEGKGEGEKT